MFSKFTIPLCTAAVLAVAPLTADALEFKFNGAENGFRAVTVDRSVPTGISDFGTGAGGFSMTDMTPGGTLGDFIAWCFDLDTRITQGQTYIYTENATLLDSVPPYFAGAKDRVQKLFDKSFDPTTVLANAQSSAGFQIAIWEVLYDDDFNLGTGNFTATNSKALDEAEGFLTGVAAYAGPRNWVITTYDSANAQDLGVATAIPLPAAAWLLLGVSGALIGAKRRSARKAA